MRAVGERAIVSIQNPIALPPRNELQPDLALLKPVSHRYRTHLPTATDILLLIEVADTTLAYDRDVKIPLYAVHGIEEVWLVDVRSAGLIVFRKPVGQTYGQVLTPSHSESISPVTLPDVMIRVVDLSS